MIQLNKKIGGQYMRKSSYTPKTSTSAKRRNEILATPIGNDVSYRPTAWDAKRPTSGQYSNTGINYTPTAFGAKPPSQQNNDFSWTGINYRPTPPYTGSQQIAKPTNAPTPTLPQVPKGPQMPPSTPIPSPQVPTMQQPQPGKQVGSTPQPPGMTGQQPVNPFTYNPYQSQYQGQINDLMGQLKGSKFEYNLEDDPLYAQYREQYTREGNRAMQDAMANAAALTGGRTNSWSQSAGSQANAYYLSQLNDKVPELANSAYNRYMNEQNQKMAQLQMLQQQDQQGYDRWSQDRNMAYGQYRDTIGDQRYNKEFDYQQGRDQVADQRYQQQFDVSEQQRAFDNNMTTKQFEVAEQQRQIDNALKNGQMSLQQYQAETARIQAQYGMYANDRDYNRGIYESDRNFGYQQSQDERNYQLAQQKAAGQGTPGAGLEYKDQLKLVMDMKNATQEQIMVPDGKNNIYDKPQKYDVPKYDDAEIADYIMNLNISDEEKVRMLNDAGVKKNDSPIQQRGVMGYNQTAAPFQMTVPNEQSKKKSKLPKFVIGSRWGV